MATSYSTLLGLALPTTGELAGTWGDTVNNYITQYLDSAVAGTQTLSTDADVTLTKTTNAALGSTSSQYAILNCTGARTALRTITAPAASKYYLVINATTGGYSVKVVGAGPTTGVTIVNGERCLIAWNGSDFVKVGGTNGSGTFTDLTVTSGNLAFTSTAQRITGDFSNATQSNRLAFQTSTTNGNTSITLLPNGTGAQGALNAFNNSDPTNAGYAQLRANATEVALDAGITGTGTYLPMNFRTNGSERMRIDTSGNVGIGRAPTAGYRLDVAAATAEVLVESTTGTNRVDLNLQNTSGVFSIGIDSSAGGVYGTAYSRAIFSSGAYPVTFWTASNERMRIDSSGNVGIGTASPSSRLEVTGANAIVKSSASSGFGSFYANAATGNAAYYFFAVNSTETARIASDASNILTFSTGSGATEQFRITSTGGITSANLADAVGYKGTPLNEQSAAYTLVIGDMGKSIVHPATDNNARTFTIPANSSVAFPVGTTITFINMINTVTISITTDTLYLAGAGTTGSRTLAAYGMATAIKMTATTWIISGNGLT